MTAEQSWEQRMAARARERKIDHEAVERRRWARQRAEVERQAIAHRAGMTLGEALALLNAEPWACACIGAPFCCRYSFIQAQALRRGAHIVAKLLAAQTQCGDVIEFDVSAPPTDIWSWRVGHHRLACSLAPGHEGAHHDGATYWDHEQREPFRVIA